MDKSVLTVLTSDIKAQMALIDGVYVTLEERAVGLGPEDESKLGWEHVKVTAE